MIVTTWSWFGVNELGVGLHSYGFTEGVLPALALAAEAPRAAQTAFFLCGGKNLVDRLKRDIFMSGARTSLSGGR